MSNIVGMKCSRLICLIVNSIIQFKVFSIQLEKLNSGNNIIFMATDRLEIIHSKAIWSKLTLLCIYMNNTNTLLSLQMMI